jgi:myosin-crossreactive antigen
MKNRANTVPRAVAVLEDGGEIDLVLEAARFDTDPMLTEGSVDGDWQRAATSDEEAGGNVAMTDDVVDEIGHALGVEQETDAPVITAAEILRARDRHYWHLERRAVQEEYA